MVDEGIFLHPAKELIWQGIVIFGGGGKSAHFEGFLPIGDCSGKRQRVRRMPAVFGEEKVAATGYFWPELQAISERSTNVVLLEVPTTTIKGGLEEIKTRLKLKNIDASVFGSVQPKHASEKGKRKRVDVDDDDYIQPNSKDHSDDEFSDSFEHEVTNMPPTRRQLFNRESSSSVDICPQFNLRTEVNVEAQTSLTTSASIGKKLLLLQELLL
ncbi:hypothetical protein U1Q18_019530 [Sarracenia purpurea var. burkii]